jgi:uncharacterized membrane protein
MGWAKFPATATLTSAACIDAEINMALKKVINALMRGDLYISIFIEDSPIEIH